MAFLKKQLTFPDIYLILVNLVPLFGVWFLGWDANRIFLIYCLETVLIGVFNVFKMLTILFAGDIKSGTKKEDYPIFFGVFMVIFFMFHYGFFVFVQTQIFFAISNVLNSRSFTTSYLQVFETLGPEGHLLLGLFASYYFLDFVFNFLQKGKYKTTQLPEQMFLPYIRIFIQQIVVIAGGIFLMFNAHSLFILLFIGIKIVFEFLYSNEKFSAYIKKNIKEEKEKELRAKQNNN
jgi:hypothetical protein